MPFVVENLPQSGDIRLRVVADSKTELFQGALEGMLGIIKPEIQQGSFKVIKVDIQAADLATLLVDFLNFVLAQMNIHLVAFSTIYFQSLTDQTLSAKLKGQPYKRLTEEIKAVTYYNLKVGLQSNGKWEASVVFDI
ncbi:MAG: archease [Candidatus Pacebacteria bacterium]|nr:archease [Candidatus Paceibacterota bacterium]